MSSRLAYDGRFKELRKSTRTHVHARARTCTHVHARARMSTQEHARACAKMHAHESEHATHSSTSTCTPRCSQGTRASRKDTRRQRSVLEDRTCPSVCRLKQTASTDTLHTSVLQTSTVCRRGHAASADMSHTLAWQSSSVCLRQRLGHEQVAQPVTFGVPP